MHCYPSQTPRVRNGVDVLCASSLEPQHVDAIERELLEYARAGTVFRFVQLMPGNEHAAKEWIRDAIDRLLNG